MKKLSIILIALLFFQSFGHSQNLFSKTYEGRNLLYASTLDVCETIDKGYIILGFSYSPDNTQQICLIKTNQSGDTLWTKLIAGMGWSYGFSIKQTSDKGYIIAGHTSKSIDIVGVAYTDLLLTKISEKGEVIWTKYFGGSTNDGAKSVEITEDQGFIVMGSANSNGFDGYNPYLIRTNVMGDTIWTKTLSSCVLGASGPDDFHTTSDGGYIIAGTTFGYNEGEWGHVYVIKLDSNGDKTWSKVFKNYNYMSDVRIKESPDRGYVIAAPNYNYIQGGNTFEILLTKIDPSGNVQWSKSFIGGGNATGNSLDKTIDGGTIVAGKTSDSLSNGCIYLIKSYSTGDIQWTKLHSIPPGNGNIIVKQTSDEGYIITGQQDEGGNKTKIFLLKTDKNGNSSEITATVPFENKTDFRVFPNPASDILNIQRNDNSKVFVELIDVNGRVVYQKTYAESLIKIEISKYPKGQYILKMTSDAKTDKTVIIKS